MNFSRFFAATVALLVCSGFSTSARAENFDLDATHSAIVFKIQHAGISWSHGRFNNVTGKFWVDTVNPAGGEFEVTIKTDSIDTNNAQRDNHLRSPDFLNTKQFPEMSFKSTSVAASKDGYKVTGDFTMHGVTKSITLDLAGGKKIQFPKGVHRTGFSTDLVLKRSEFGMNKFLEGIGDDVHISISFEGTHK